MTRRILALAFAAGLILSSAMPVTAEWIGYNWKVAPSPPTVVPLYDSSPFPDLVLAVTEEWSQTTALRIEYHRADSCQSKAGRIAVCTAYQSGRPASWTEIRFSGGTGQKTIQRVLIPVNTWNSMFALPPDPVLAAARRYVVCHEIGHGLGLLEKRWPYDPAAPDWWHYGCMNIAWQGQHPSPADLDTLLTVYGPG